MIFISKFYLYKCSHRLGNHECPSSCKSQECWYSLHLCDSHDFHPNLRSRPLEVVSTRKKGITPVFLAPKYSPAQENNQFCSMLIASGKTDGFTHWERRKHKSRAVPPVMAYTGKLRPNCEMGTFSSLQVWLKYMRG